jgi:hypothetical protein
MLALKKVVSVFLWDVPRRTAIIVKFQIEMDYFARREEIINQLDYKCPGLSGVGDSSLKSFPVDLSEGFWGPSSRLKLMVTLGHPECFSKSLSHLSGDNDWY